MGSCIWRDKPGTVVCGRSCVSIDMNSAPFMPRTIRGQRRVAEVNVEPGTAIPEPSPTLCESDAARYISMGAGWLKKSRTTRFRREMDAPPLIRCGTRRVVYRRVDLDTWLARHQQTVGRETSKPEQVAAR